MSLPKEPRQKMINIMYLVLTALLALNVSSEILNAFRTVRRSLENSNATVNQSTSLLMKSLEEKSIDPQTLRFRQRVKGKTKKKLTTKGTKNAKKRLVLINSFVNFVLFVVKNIFLNSPKIEVK